MWQIADLSTTEEGVPFDSLRPGCHILDVEVAEVRVTSARYVVLRLFGDKNGIVVQVESEGEAPGHDSCGMRTMDGDSSLRLLLGL